MKRFEWKKNSFRMALSALALCVMFGAAVNARMPENGVKDKPRGFSPAIKAVDGHAVLPPPPAFDSVYFMYDKAMYEVGLSMRNTERGRQAEADVDEFDMQRHFSEAFGMDITPEKTPELFKLIERSNEDIYSAARTAKEAYKRTRPYLLYNAPTCYRPDEERLRYNSSYPSGHSARGWGLALVLSEVNPARKEAILRRGYEYGQSRVICGYHWQSDVDAGRLAGAAGAANLHNNPEFMRQLQKAKDEFARLSRKANKGKFHK